MAVVLTVRALLRLADAQEHAVGELQAIRGLLERRAPEEEPPRNPLP